jgi:hypothetical protein
MYEVRVADSLVAIIADRWGPDRSSAGRGSEYDFWSGPLPTALAQFANFDRLPWSVVPQVRSLLLIDPVFGPLAFVGVLVADGTVEVVSVDDDPDYWEVIDDDPDD